MLIDVDNVNQAESPTSGYIIFSKTHMAHMFYTLFFKRNQLGMVSDMSEASKSFSSTSTMSTRPSLTSGLVIFLKTHMAHVLCPILQEKSIGNGLTYVRGI